MGGPKGAGDGSFLNWWVGLCSGDCTWEGRGGGSSKQQVPKWRPETRHREGGGGGKNVHLPDVMDEGVFESQDT